VFREDNKVIICCRLEQKARVPSLRSPLPLQRQFNETPPGGGEEGGIQVHQVWQMFHPEEKPQISLGQFSVFYQRQ